MQSRSVFQFVLVAILVSAFLPLAEAQSRKKRDRRSHSADRYVFVTGSAIPQRIKDDGRATEIRNTVGGSALLILNRRRIDETGRFTAADILRSEPSLSVRGF